MSAIAGRLESRPAGLLPAALTGVIATTLGAAVALDPRAAAILAAALLAPVLVWAAPRVAFALLAISLGLNLDLLRAPVFVSLPQLAAIALTAAVFIRRPPAGIRAGLAAGAGLLFLVATLPSVPAAVDPGAAYTGLVKLAVLALLLTAAVRGTVERWVRPERLTDWLVAGALLSLVPAFTQVLVGIGPESFRVGGVMRAWSTYTQPNSYGLYLAGLFPVALGVALARRRLAGFAAAAAILLTIGLTGSRGAWAGAAAGLLAFFAATTRWRAAYVAAAAFGLLALVGLASLVPTGLIAGRFDLGDWSLQQRVLLLLTAWDGILRNPIAGYGGGSFEHLLPAIARRGLTDDVVLSHNVLLDIWFELGLTALLCFVALITAFLVRAFRAARRTHDPRLAGLFAGVTGMLVAALFGTLFIRGVQETFVLLMAAGIGLMRLAPRHPPETYDAPAPAV